MIKEADFSEVKSSIQHRLKTKCHLFYVECLNKMVSQSLVELQRTLIGQNGVEFDFQSIEIHCSCLRHKNGNILGHFLKILGHLEKENILK